MDTWLYVHQFTSLMRGRNLLAFQENLAGLHKNPLWLLEVVRLSLSRIVLLIVYGYWQHLRDWPDTQQSIVLFS